MPAARHPGTRTSLRDALEEIRSLIAEARRQLAATAPGAAPDTATFRSAEDELGAVVEQSAAAAETILSACEELDVLTRAAADPDGALRDCTMRIFEACAFQDLVAQRVKKVAMLVREIEARLRGVAEAAPAPVVAEVDLANGPALPQVAPGQAEIDRLLADD